jgi:hypothetical protein
MNQRVQLEEALALALQLNPKERLQLIERVASSVERDMDSPADDEQIEEHWGKALNRLMDEIGPIEMLYPEIEDPVEWVKHHRAERRRHRLGDWGAESQPDDTP